MLSYVSFNSSIASYLSNKISFVKSTWWNGDPVFDGFWLDADGHKNCKKVRVHNEGTSSPVTCLEQVK